MAFSLSEVFSGAALILAVGSPIITAAINSHTQKRERKAVFYLQMRAEAFEKYLRSTGSLIISPSEQTRKEYGEAMGCIFLMVDENTSQKILQLDRDLAPRQLSDRKDAITLNRELYEISRLLLPSYPRLKNKRRNKHT